ncbi:MAG: polysaccharide deacetylase family protein, partial [Candidatus Methanoperedens sp.]
PNSGRLIFYFTSYKNWSKYFYYGVGTETKGWNKFVIPKTDISNRGGEDWNNTMVLFRLAYYPVAGHNTDLTIDHFRHDLSGRAKVIFTFDDGTVGDMEAETILTENNQTAMSFVVINQTTLNSQYYMDLDNIKKLQSSGWDISSHTISHPHLDSLDNNNLITELNNSYDWLVNHGFQKTAGFLAYPYGSYNDIVIEKTKQRYILARSTENGIEPHLSADYGNLYKLKITSIHNTTSVQSIKDRINSTIDQGLLTILNFHRIVDKNPTMYEYSKSDLQQISDYIKSRDRDIDVVTLSNYLNANIINYTPIINKTVRIYSNGTVNLLTNNKYDEYMPNMTIEPSSGYIDISVNKYEDQVILFNETVNNLLTEVKYSIGDRVANQNYSIKTYLNNGSIVQNIYVKANDTGYINYFSNGFDKSSYTEIKPYFSKVTENNVLTVEILIQIIILIIIIAVISLAK